MRLTTLGLTLAAASLSVSGRAAAPDCAAVTPALPAGFDGWTAPVARPAGHDARSAPTAAIGQAIRATLTPMAGVRFATPPGKAGAGYGGLFTVAVERAGTYRIGLSGPAWLDVLTGERALVSTAHGHGPACSGIGKIVDFTLKPGRYLVQLAGSPAAEVTLIVTREP